MSDSEDDVQREIPDPGGATASEAGPADGSQKGDSPTEAAEAAAQAPVVDDLEDQEAQSPPAA